MAICSVPTQMKAFVLRSCVLFSDVVEIVAPSIFISMEGRIDLARVLDHFLTISRRFR